MGTAGHHSGGSQDEDEEREAGFVARVCVLGACPPEGTSQADRDDEGNDSKDVQHDACLLLKIEPADYRPGIRLSLKTLAFVPPHAELPSSLKLISRIGRSTERMTSGPAAFAKVEA
jgi:hypothetical protein